jgi:hypothetical protein
MVLGALVASYVGVLAAPGGAVDCDGIVTADDAYTVQYGKKLTVAKPSVLANDSGTGLKVDVTLTDEDSWYNGTVTLGPAGALTYKPPAGFTGEDSFDYWVIDACDDSDLATVTVTVTPIMANDAYTVGYGKKLTVKAPGVLGNDQGTEEVWSWPAKSKQGGTVVGNDDGSFTYTPKSGFSGVDSFTYQAIDTNFDNTYPATVKITVGARPSSPPPSKPPAATSVPQGYWMVEANGVVHPFGQVKNKGNANTTGVTHFEPTPSHQGYWVVNAAGKVFAFGDAKSFGNAGALGAGEIVSSLSATPKGDGYWLFTNRGRVMAFGKARSYGDMSRVALNGPVVGSIATPSGKGYYMVGSDGGIFTFGDAVFRGSMGAVRLDQPVQGLVPTADNRGYWLVASDGGIFAFGNATFRGSMGGTRLNAPVVGMVRYGNGYLMVASDGGIFAFSNKPFLGSLGANPPSVPIVSVAA